MWDEKPDWLGRPSRASSNLWAPELIEHDGTWYLYYAASTFGTNRSVIALATNRTLDPDDPDYEWVDRGAVVASTTSDDFNAIDPGIIEDAEGTPWMAFGSFWSGIRMVELGVADGMRADDAEPLRLADRGARRTRSRRRTSSSTTATTSCSSRGTPAARALDSTYNVMVGRAERSDRAVPRPRRRARCSRTAGPACSRPTAACASAPAGSPRRTA